jgi:hypothetical protein
VGTGRCQSVSESLDRHTQMLVQRFRHKADALVIAEASIAACSQLLESLICA